MSAPDGPRSDVERRSLLLAAKLKGLVHEHRGVPAEGEVQPHPAGVALVVGGGGWVLVDGPASRQLGGALAWAVRAGVDRLDLVADLDTSLLARRAERIGFPIGVWHATGRALLPAVAEPLAPPPAAPPTHLAMAELIEAGGATVNVEHGVVFGEVRGLEVCRVVAEPTTGTIADSNEVPRLLPRGRDADEVILEVGVGANDREAFRLLHGDVPAVEAVRDVVESVRRHRRDDAPHHPLNRMARERYLRWRLEQDPALVGLVSLAPAEPPVPRPTLRQSVPCVAQGIGPSGEQVRVVCSTGIDTDLVGYVADVQQMSGDTVHVALPARDKVAITDELLALLCTPAVVHTVE